MVLDASLLNTQHYKVRIKGKVEPSREGVAPSPTPWCSSYRKGSLRVTLDYARQLYLPSLLLHSLQLSRDLQQFLFFVNHSYAHISLLCFPLVMLSASHWLLAQARFCGRTYLPLSPNSTTPTVQVFFRYLRPDAPVFNITTVGMVTFRQSPCWYYPWADVVLSTSSDTQHLRTWWHFGDHTGLIYLSVNNIRRIHICKSR